MSHWLFDRIAGSTVLKDRRLLHRVRAAASEPDTGPAARIIRECLTGIAMRKRGITEDHYPSPLTVDHGQP